MGAGPVSSVCFKWILSFSGLTSVPGDHLGGFQDLLGTAPRPGRVPELDEQVSGKHCHRTWDRQLLQPIRWAPGFGEKGLCMSLQSIVRKVFQSLMQDCVDVLFCNTPYFLFLFLEVVTSICDKVRKSSPPLSLFPQCYWGHFNIELISSSSLCFVIVSFFPICVESPPGPGNICAGTVVKALQPYLFIFPLIS